MIKITRINGEQMIVSADLIEFIESTPDTLITLTTGHKVIAKETVAQVIGRVVMYERSIRIGGRHKKRKYHLAHGESTEGNSL